LRNLEMLRQRLDFDHFCCLYSVSDSHQ